MSETRPDFRYPNQEAILRRLAAAHGLSYEDVLDAPYGTDGFYIRKQAIGLASGKVVATKQLHFEPMEDHKGLKIVGQNGVPADVTHWSFGQLAGLAKALRVIEGGGERPYEKGDPWWHGATGPIDEERPPAFPNLRRKLAAMPLLGKIGFALLVIISWLPIIAAILGIAAALSGCASLNTHDPCVRCIGPYDPALRSHREAIIDTLKD